MGLGLGEARAMDMEMGDGCRCTTEDRGTRLGERRPDHQYQLEVVVVVVVVTRGVWIMCPRTRRPRQVRRDGGKVESSEGNKRDRMKEKEMGE